MLFVNNKQVDDDDDVHHHPFIVFKTIGPNNLKPQTSNNLKLAV